MRPVELDYKQRSLQITGQTRFMTETIWKKMDTKSPITRNFIADR